MRDRRRLASTLCAFIFAVTVAHAADFGRTSLPDLPMDVVPLYVMGDLNGDNVVDATDERLIRQLIAATARGKEPPPQITCLAAGDLDLDSQVTHKDAAMLKRWLHAGRAVAVPALHWEPSLPCTFTHPLFASRVDSIAGEAVPILFIDKGLTTRNTNAILVSGPAQISPRGDGSGYDVAVSTGARDGDFVRLILLLPGRRAYTYTIPIVSTPKHK
jgi:hypothetical protein